VDDIYLISTLSKQAGVIVENLSLLQEARQHEESIQEWEKLYETMAHTLQVGIYVIENGKFVFVNPKFQTDLGFEEDELLKADPLTLIHPEDRETVRENAVRMLRGELSSPFEYRAIARSGETRVGMGTLALIQRKRRAAYLGYHMDITERKQAEQALKEAALQTLDALAGIEEANDPYTAGHSTRVTELALRIATEMGLGEDELNVLRIAGPLHDMGKIGITQSVLNKPSKLTQAEWLMIRAHPVMSAETAERVVAFRDAVPAIRHHHERWDGTGYPDGLKEEHIPLPARILAVADAFEAMTSERPYRGPLTQDEALAELRTGAGTQWDPDAVKALLRIVAAQNLPASF
jgi:PAS domain S-box-containing protein